MTSRPAAYLKRRAPPTTRCCFLKAPHSRINLQIPKCLDGSDPTYNRQGSPKARIPHTEVCGWFRSNLQTANISETERIPHTEVCGWFRSGLKTMSCDSKSRLRLAGKP